MFLGIDIGTGKAAAVIVSDGRVLEAASRAYPGSTGEQDAEALFAAAMDAVRDLPEAHRRAVMAVGITSQVHGVVCCDAAMRPLTPLINWQDRRVLRDPGFLPALEAATGHPLAAGFGTVTLAWLDRHGGIPAGTAQFVAIGDYAAARLTGAAKAVTDPTNAAAFGLFDLAARNWDWSAIEAARLPAAKFPPVAPSGSLAGRLADGFGLPRGIPVTVAIGDNQASLLATVRKPERQLALTLGTGGQVSAVLPEGFALPGRVRASWEIRPYPGPRYLVTAASLNGGAAWRWLAGSVNGWLRDLGFEPPPEDRAFARLNELGLAAGEGPAVVPQFAGERHARKARGEIAGLGPEGLRLGELARGLARGIVRNLRDMLPPFAFEERTEVVASGNALRLNPLLAAMTEEVFALPLVRSEVREEAAAGAALLAGRLSG